MLPLGVHERLPFQLAPRQCGEFALQHFEDIGVRVPAGRAVIPEALSEVGDSGVAGADLAGEGRIGGFELCEGGCLLCELVLQPIQFPLH